MSSQREISLWLDERWYAAINRQLKDETLEEHLESVIDELCNRLPERVYDLAQRSGRSSNRPRGWRCSFEAATQ